MPYYLGKNVSEGVLPGHIEVFNYCAGARTITEGGQNRFQDDNNYENVKKSEPDAIAMMFGSNDCYDATW